MPLSNNELNLIHLKNQSILNKRYYGHDGRVYIGVKNGRLKLEDQADETTFNDNKAHLNARDVQIAIENIVSGFNINAQNAVGSILINTPTINFVYNSIIPSITANLNNTTVVAGTYGGATNSTQIIVDAQGRITSAVNVPIVVAPGAIALTNTHILVGNGVNVATDVALSLSATPGSFSLANTGILTMPDSGAALRGLLNSTDWNTFNNKQTAGNYITALTGDITATGPGSVVGTLATVNITVGTFTNATITVNAKGLITSASSGVGGVSSVSNTDGTLTISPTTGAVIASLNLAHSNTWTAQQTFSISNPIFSAITQGSVLFAGAGGVVSEDNANFFWDDTTNRLGLGTSSPLTRLHVVQASPGVHGTILSQHTSNTAGSDAVFLALVAGASAGDAQVDFSISGIQDWGIGIDNSDSDSFVIGESTSLGTNTRLYIAVGGNVSIGNSAPVSLFNVGSASQFRIDSVGAILAATGITSSGTITFSGLSSVGIVHNSAAGVLSTSLVSLTADVVGILLAVNGGTGFGSYTIGDLLYADTATTLAKLADIATGNALISGGVGVAPSWGKIGLSTHVTGTLPIANGGTGQTTAIAAFNALSPLTTLGDTLYNDGTNDVRLAGNTGAIKYLTQTGAAGVSAAPVWNSLPVAATLQTTAANPATTTSTTGVMKGLGSSASITPSASGKVQVSVTGDIDNNTGADGCTVILRYGTGTAPTDGAALTGTTIGSQIIMTEGNASGLLGVTYTPPRFPFSLSAVITGLTVGTAYWLDISLAAVTGGTARVRNVTVSALESTT